MRDWGSDLYPQTSDHLNTDKASLSPVYWQKCKAYVHTLLLADTYIAVSIMISVLFTVYAYSPFVLPCLHLDPKQLGRTHWGPMSYTERIRNVLICALLPLSPHWAWVLEPESQDIFLAAKLSRSLTAQLSDKQARAHSNVQLNSVFKPYINCIFNRKRNSQKVRLALWKIQLPK